MRRDHGPRRRRPGRLKSMSCKRLRCRNGPPAGTWSFVVEGARFGRGAGDGTHHDPACTASGAVLSRSSLGRYDPDHAPDPDGQKPDRDRRLPLRGSPGPWGSAADYAVLSEFDRFRGHPDRAREAPTVRVRLIFRLVRESDATVIATRAFHGDRRGRRHRHRGRRARFRPRDLGLSCSTPSAGSSVSPPSPHRIWGPRRRLGAAGACPPLGGAEAGGRGGGAGLREEPTTGQVDRIGPNRGPLWGAGRGRRQREAAERKQEGHPPSTSR